MRDILLAAQAGRGRRYDVVDGYLEFCCELPELKR
jgi:hypothetical protein